MSDRKELSDSYDPDLWVDAMLMQGAREVLRRHLIPGVRQLGNFIERDTGYTTRVLTELEMIRPWDPYGTGLDLYGAGPKL